MIVPTAMAIISMTNRKKANFISNLLKGISQLVNSCHFLGKQVNTFSYRAGIILTQRNDVSWIEVNNDFNRRTLVSSKGQLLKSIGDWWVVHFILSF